MPVDGVADLSGTPSVVSVSDVHGHRDRFESALLTLADHPGYEAIIERGSSGDLTWVGGEEYVLVVNGDVVDRGPGSPGCLALLRRLQRRAPDGHVRYLLGNHELYLPYPSPPEWDRWFTGAVDTEFRRRFLEWVVDGDVTVAFEGHEYTYVHAGSRDGVDVEGLNDRFLSAAAELRDGVGDDDPETFERVIGRHCPTVYGDIDDETPIRENSDVGIVWLDFRFLSADSPPQVVGHTPHDEVTRRGNVVCQDVILENVDSPGGETVLVETDAELRALVRNGDGSVSERRM